MTIFTPQKLSFHSTLFYVHHKNMKNFWGENSTWQTWSLWKAASQHHSVNKAIIQNPQQLTPFLCSKIEFLSLYIIIFKQFYTFFRRWFDAMEIGREFFTTFSKVWTRIYDFITNYTSVFDFPAKKASKQHSSCHRRLLNCYISYLKVWRALHISFFWRENWSIEKKLFTKTSVRHKSNSKPFKKF